MPTVLITGAGSGIGRAAARRFAADGWRCILVDRDADALARLLPTLPGRHDCRKLDLTDVAQVRTLAAVPGPIDAVINNAGASDPRGLALVDQPASDQAALLALNLQAPAAVVEAVQGRLEGGARIVSVSSGAGLRALPMRGWYSATKAGLIAQSLALARARPDLVVTVLCPGFVRTELVDALVASGRLDPGEALAKTPLGRMAEPEEMAAMLHFLASRDAAPIRGQVIRLCGGSSVYGGSRPCAAATGVPYPLDAPSATEVRGDAGGTWTAALHGSGAAHARQEGRADYRAVVDVGALGLPEPDLLVATVHEASRRFAKAHDRDASLTVLLPAGRADAPAHWARAGHAAAARMLVATLACELAQRALRVNAIVVPRGARPARLAPLVRHVAGPGSQFLTGQTFDIAEAPPA